MNEPAMQRDPLERLADEFAARYRRGELPTIAEYAARYPRHAEKIEALFPAVAMLEQLRGDRRSKRGSAAGDGRSAPPPDRIGDFQIVREIGRGGMGIVYEAEQRSLARRVAVKVLPKHLLLLERHLKRFQREARTAARLRHTNIVPVFGVGEQEGLHYYVMPLIRGVGLDAVIRRLQSDGKTPANRSTALRQSGHTNGSAEQIVRKAIAQRFPDQSCEPGDAATGPIHRSGRTAAEHPSADQRREAEPADRWSLAARVGIQAAEALDYAHRQGTLHRDIKPANLLIDACGIVSVADFGLARAVERSGASHASEVVGTLRYMAPEQLRGKADCRSDIYALGLTLYELLTLRPALEDRRRRARLSTLQVAFEPVPPRRIDRAIPRDLETIVLKCLAHDPAQRYQTAAELASDLRLFLEDRPIQARRASPAERAWRWSRRNPALAAVSALAAVLLAALAVALTTGYVQTKRAYANAAHAYHEAHQALERTEATSRLATEALDRIYGQLSPDRVRVGSARELGGREGAEPAPDRSPSAVQASNETALLLENLLVFYDRLAEQGQGDPRVAMESAVASRRVGDIRQRLGQFDRAEREYVKAVDKLTVLRSQPGMELAARIETARALNEIGNIRTARFEFRQAFESHVEALAMMQHAAARSPGDRQYRYELARTLYYLASKRLGGLGNRRGRPAGRNSAASGPHHFRSGQYRDRAIRILDQLVREQPHDPDCRYLLALCHRLSHIGHAWGRSATSAEGRQRAIAILEELVAQCPDVADYRYELSASYADVPVGLFPWQQNSEAPDQAERSLLEALDHAQWLVTHNPTLPEYARSQTFILAKLGAVCWQTGRLDEARGLLQQAVETQERLVSGFPDLPSHNRVLLEFLRLREAQLDRERNGSSQSPERTRSSHLAPVGRLQACIEQLTELIQRPELAQDRLARSSLRLAWTTLAQAYAEAGQQREASEAQKQAEKTRSRTAP